jgi:hypothetical protein
MRKKPICCVLQQTISSYNQFLVAWVSHVQRQAGLPADRLVYILEHDVQEVINFRITVTSSCRICTCFPFHPQFDIEQKSICTSLAGCLAHHFFHWKFKKQFSINIKLRTPSASYKIFITYNSTSF